MNHIRRVANRVESMLNVLLGGKQVIITWYKALARKPVSRLCQHLSHAMMGRALVEDLRGFGENTSHRQKLGPVNCPLVPALKGLIALKRKAKVDQNALHANLASLKDSCVQKGLVQQHVKRTLAGHMCCVWEMISWSDDKPLQVLQTWFNLAVRFNPLQLL